MLAFLPAPDIEAVLPDASHGRGALLQELEKIRQAGIAISGGAISGIRGVAAPVFDRDGRCVASVAITGPEVRLSEARLPAVGDAARAAAAAISAVLGYGGNEEQAVDRTPPSHCPPLRETRAPKALDAAPANPIVLVMKHLSILRTAYEAQR